MKITRENYEAFFLDYLEGNLDEHLLGGFMNFLKENPDLKEELSLLDPEPLKPLEILYRGKDKLYKEKYDTEAGFNRAAIGMAEGDISATEKSAFEDFLSRHPEKQKEAQLFAKTKLHPDMTLVYPKKSALYHRKPTQIFLQWSVRIAAVFILGLMFYFFLNQNAGDPLNDNDMALLDDASGKKENTFRIAEIKQRKQGETDRILQQDTAPGKSGSVAVQTASNEPIPGKRDWQDSEGSSGSEEMSSPAIRERIPAKVPDRIGRQKAFLQAGPEPDLSLVAMSRVPVETGQLQARQKPVGEIVREKTGLNTLSLGIIARAGLNIVSKISKERFEYKTNPEGELTSLSYDSRLVAFYIPTDN